MEIVRIVYLVVLIVSILIFHWFGSRQARVTATGEGSKAPVAAKKVDSYVKPEPEPPSPPLLPKVDPPKAVGPKPIVASIDGYTAEDAVRRPQAHFLPCHGGPNDGRYSIFPGDFSAALNIGSFNVFITGFEPFKPGPEDSTTEDSPKSDPETKPAVPPTAVPPKKPESLETLGTTRFYIPTQDQRRMGIEGFYVYALENVDTVPRLAYVGTVDLFEYGRFLRLDKSVALPGHGEPTDYIDIRTSENGVRRQKVFQTMCVGGPADGKMYPLLTSPDILWDSGLAMVVVTEFGFRPKEFTIGSNRKKPATNFVGRANLYVLEELRDAPHSFGRRAGFQLKFQLSLDATSYLSIHNRIVEE